MKRFILSLCFASLLLPKATGQDVRVQAAAEEPPYYVGVGAIIQLTVEGLDGDPRPECEVKNLPNGLRATLLGLNPQVMRQTFQSGGQIRVLERVTYKIQYRITADSPGDYDVGPFVISQGKTKERVEPISMTFQAVPKTDDMKVQLVMPETAYPDQRVPVTIEWWFAGDTENINELSIYSDVFDKFQFAPDKQPSRRGVQTMPIQTQQGELKVLANARQETQDGKTYIVLSAQRTLVPDRPGQFDLEPIVSTIELVTQWQRSRSTGFPSLFDDVMGGRRRPAKVERFRAEGEPFTFTVKPFPAKNKPQSFTGSVGKGFTLDVAADRTVVRAGDPIRLTIRLRGDGNVQGASLPPLSADDGLNPEQFRLPDNDVAGEFTNGAKEFVVSVRVQDDGVNEIPAIAYSWFDTDSETYLTTRSDPIALRVNPTEMIGVDAVVSNQPKSTDDPSTESLPRTAKTYSLTGADLAIERDPAKLLASNKGILGQPSVQAVSYGAGVMLLAIAFFDRRRRQVDPQERHATALVRRERQRVSEAGRMPAKEGAAVVADALRNVAAEFSQSDRGAMQSVMSQCESLSYQPNSSSTQTLDQSLVQQALTVIDQLSQRGKA